MRATEAHLIWLDDLRESGATNMFGAAPFLAEAFGLTTTEARGILQEWMTSFSVRHPVSKTDG
jgi:hypothetical protein